jgi:hypothetical protein
VITIGLISLSSAAVIFMGNVYLEGLIESRVRHFINTECYGCAKSTRDGVRSRKNKHIFNALIEYVGMECT